MLADFLATIIAFITIILLLSIVVTALVQTSQATLRLRSRNLLKGLAALIMKARGDVPSAGLGALRNQKQVQAKKDAARLLNTPNIALLNHTDKPDSFMNYWVLGPKVSWVPPDELETALAADKRTADNADTIIADFKKMEGPLKKRFLFIVRMWTFAWALVVAFSFQVSTPQLFSRLSEDAELRARIVAESETVLAHQEETLAKLDYESVAPDALETLQSRYAVHSDLLEQAGGVGVNRQFLLEELRLVLEDVPDRDKMVAEYDQLLDEYASARQEVVQEEIESTLADLQRFGIDFWPHDWGFYCATDHGIRWDALIGVLMTAILLSLGAPFWYERLREAIMLRDILSGRSGSRKTTPVTRSE